MFRRRPNHVRRGCPYRMPRRNTNLWREICNCLVGDDHIPKNSIVSRCSFSAIIFWPSQVETTNAKRKEGILVRTSAPAGCCGNGASSCQYGEALPRAACDLGSPGWNQPPAFRVGLKANTRLPLFPASVLHARIVKCGLSRGQHLGYLSFHKGEVGFPSL